MGVTASLGEVAPVAQPGEPATIDVEVHNDGPAGQAVELRVEGPAKPYAFVVPSSLQVAAGATAPARLGFRVPRTSLPAAGPLPFRLEVAVAGEGVAATAEGVLTVAPFTSVSATLEPSEAEGRGPTEHRLRVANRGNAPATVALSADGDGLDVQVDPLRLVAGPGDTATATVRVTPRRRGAAETTFAVTAAPEGGDPVRAAGRRRVVAPSRRRLLIPAAAVAGVLALALVAWGLASTGGSPDPAASSDGPAPLSDCPAAGHVDVRGATGLRPDDIPKLPNTYSFLHVRSDNCTPVRFNPCEPIHYVQNAAQAPPTGQADVREAFNRLAQATGMTFVDDGLTDESVFGRRNPNIPSRYPGRWAPILVNWAPFPDQGPNPEIQAVGFGIGSRVGDVLVSGVLSLNVNAVTNKETRAPLQGGFGPPLGSGTGPIGPEGVTWGRIILHELAHVVGLGHTRDKGAIMYPESAEQTSRPADLRPPDREGLRYLGREAGCLTTPPVPTT